MTRSRILAISLLLAFLFAGCGGADTGKQAPADQGKPGDLAPKKDADHKHVPAHEPG
jgi:hypothetical protein